MLNVCCGMVVFLSRDCPCWIVVLCSMVCMLGPCQALARHAEYRHTFVALVFVQIYWLFVPPIINDCVPREPVQWLQLVTWIWMSAWMVWHQGERAKRRKATQDAAMV